MKYMTLIVGFAFIAHVKSQLEVNVEDLLYEEEDEEDDEAGASTTTTRRTRTRRSTVATTRPPTTLPPAVGTGLATNLTNGNLTANQNHTFVLQQTNSSFFGNLIASTAGQGATTERVHYVLGQVGKIWNNVGSLNITGIVDQSLGIRNHNFVRPLITGILNVVLCNPITFSNNNCRNKKAKVGENFDLKGNVTTAIPISNQTFS